MRVGFAFCLFCLLAIVCFFIVSSQRYIIARINVQTMRPDHLYPLALMKMNLTARARARGRRPCPSSMRDEAARLVNLARAATHGAAVRLGSVHDRQDPRV
jgi:hypothetical protein